MDHHGRFWYMNLLLEAFNGPMLKVLVRKLWSIPCKKNPRRYRELLGSAHLWSRVFLCSSKVNSCRNVFETKRNFGTDVCFQIQVSLRSQLSVRTSKRFFWALLYKDFGNAELFQGGWKVWRHWKSTSNTSASKTLKSVFVSVFNTWKKLLLPFKIADYSILPDCLQFSRCRLRPFDLLQLWAIVWMLWVFGTH